MNINHPPFFIKLKPTLQPFIHWLRNESHHLLILFSLIVVAFCMRGFLSEQSLAQPVEVISSDSLNQPSTKPTPVLFPFSSLMNTFDTAVQRQPLLHTDLPFRARQDVLQYTVQSADTVLSIAKNYLLSPSTILWANYEVLRDDPHNLRPGQSLFILPADGTYYQWHSGDSLESVASFYSVPIKVILEWSGNHLRCSQSAFECEHDDSGMKVLPSGEYLFIPSARRDFVTRSVPRITREKPEEAKILGDGFCEDVGVGPVGSGKGIFPTENHFLDGYDYVPEANHYGIDLSGAEGSPLFAADHGIVVYVGWNDWGYGNIIVIDHGNEWQSLYAHLSAFQVTCGQIVYQGDPIGLLGSSGSVDHPNLHFELLNESLGRVSPWNFLP